MRLKHSDIWRAIDRLADQHGLSASGLAKEAGLSPTVFNPSKRVFRKRKRWPSTQSIAQILNATDTAFEDFVGLVFAPAEKPRKALPLISLSVAQEGRHFGEEGLPLGKAWEKWKAPSFSDPSAFALEITGSSALPLYRDGEIIVLSPAVECARGDRVALSLQKGSLRLGELGRENERSIELFPFDETKPAVIFKRADVRFMTRIVFTSQ